MAGMAIGAVTSLVPEIFKMVQSGQDKALGEQYLNTPRPTFQTPDEVFRAYKRLQSLDPMPGKGRIEEGLEETTSGGVRAAKELGRPSEALAAVLGLYGNQMGQRRQLGIMEAENRRQQQKDLAEFETDILAPYKTQAWDINQFQPYQEAQRAAAALLSSSEQNKFGALEGFSAIGTTLAGQRGDMKKPGVGGSTSLSDY